MSELTKKENGIVEYSAVEARLEELRAELERQRAEIEAARAALEDEKQKAEPSPPTTPDTNEAIQDSETVAADLKEGIVTTAGTVIDEETPEEQAAKTLAFTCSLGNEQAQAVVEMIKTGNVPFVGFFQHYSFDHWWYNEGSGMKLKENEDKFEHTERISRIAWINGEFSKSR